LFAKNVIRMRTAKYRLVTKFAASPGYRPTDNRSVTFMFAGSALKLEFASGSLSFWV